MIYLNTYTDPSCLPFLSDNYIDDFCNNLVRRFDSGVIDKLHPLNIDQFIKQFLGLDIAYENLSCDETVLGVTMFADSEHFPVYDDKKRKAKYIFAKKDTVFIDKSLSSASKNNRRRFTLAHEAGHALWHGMYFDAKLKASKARVSYLSCTTDSIKLSTSAIDKSKLNKRGLLEYQANKTAAALLMPKDAVIRLISPMGPCLSRHDAEDRVIYTSATFRVSDVAAKNRLVSLGLINIDPTSRPRRIELTA